MPCYLVTIGVDQLGPGVWCTFCLVVALSPCLLFVVFVVFAFGLFTLYDKLGAQTGSFMTNGRFICRFSCFGLPCGLLL